MAIRVLDRSTTPGADRDADAGLPSDKLAEKYSVSRRGSIG